MLLLWSWEDQNPRNLFPCDWLLWCPQREGEEKGEKRENMSRERQLNMTKPVPGDPLFSSPDPHEPLLFSPSLLIPCSPFLPPTSSWPLQVHFSPLMQMALRSLHIYDLLPPLLNMRLRTEGLECCQSHWISEYQWSDNLSVRVSEEQTLERKHSWGGFGLQTLCVALRAIKMKRVWLMCVDVISAQAAWMMVSSISSAVIVLNAEGRNVFMVSPLI